MPALDDFARPLSAACCVRSLIARETLLTLLLAQMTPGHAHRRPLPQSRAESPALTLPRACAGWNPGFEDRAKPGLAQPGTSADTEGTDWDR
jgi:hypothetical protein